MNPFWYGMVRLWWMRLDLWVPAPVHSAPWLTSRGPLDRGWYPQVLWAKCSHLSLISGHVGSRASATTILPMYSVSFLSVCSKFVSLSRGVFTQTVFPDNKLGNIIGTVIPASTDTSVNILLPQTIWAPASGYRYRSLSIPPLSSFLLPFIPPSLFHFLVIQTLHYCLKFT